MDYPKLLKRLREVVFSYADDGKHNQCVRIIAKVKKKCAFKPYVKPDWKIQQGLFRYQ